jgi:hypothetical protein
MQPRIYTYKIRFEEIPHWYWGIHKERVHGETYLGSPCTHKWMWEFYTPKIQILEFFAYTESGWRDANAIERRLIYPDLNNPLCLNESCGGVMSWEVSSKNGSNSLKKLIEKNPNHQTEAGKKGNQRAKELGVGIYEKENQIKGGLITGPILVWNNGVVQIKSWECPGEEWTRGNIPHPNSIEALKANGYLPWWTDGISEKRSYKTPGENWRPGRLPKLLTSNFNYESSRESGKKSMSQRYIDPDHPELGSKPAPVLSRMQKSKGYPNKPENRIRVQ